MSFLCTKQSVTQVEIPNHLQYFLKVTLFQCICNIADILFENKCIFIQPPGNVHLQTLVTSLKDNFTETYSQCQKCIQRIFWQKSFNSLETLRQSIRFVENQSCKFVYLQMTRWIASKKREIENFSVSYSSLVSWKNRYLKSHYHDVISSGVFSSSSFCSFTCSAY